MNRNQLKAAVSSKLMAAQSASVKSWLQPGNAIMCGISSGNLKAEKRHRKSNNGV